jgi:AcrR family transcriptional regulator
MQPAAVAIDRRHRRRLETIEEVLDLAVEIMGEEGVAGLSLGEIARRMGFRPPSLYVYFPSKHALYDALFKRGWELLLEDLRRYDAELPRIEDDLATVLTRFGQRFARWSVEHVAYAQLLIWRPVPGFQPSEDAYEPAVRLYEQSTARFRVLQQRGIVRPDADVDVMHRQWTTLVSGVVSQQLANAPHEPFESGRFTTQIPALATMFANHYAGPRRSRTAEEATGTQSTTGRRANAGQR